MKERSDYVFCKNFLHSNIYFLFQADSVVVAQITYQSLFKLYPKLSGMTGTAKTEVFVNPSNFLLVICSSKNVLLFLTQEKEFLKMFHMPVIEVPTNLPNIRHDLHIQAFAVRYLNIFVFKN